MLLKADDDDWRSLSLPLILVSPSLSLSLFSVVCRWRQSAKGSGFPRLFVLPYSRRCRRGLVDLSFVGACSVIFGSEIRTKVSTETGVRYEAVTVLDDEETLRFVNSYRRQCLPL